ncbi:hypothetical protein ACFLS8_05805 [Chloroflexota bacterium]
MPIRPSWHDEYWKGLDKETASKIRTTCPRCGSSKTYYNKQFRTWRCGDKSFLFYWPFLYPVPSSIRRASWDESAS